MKKILLLYLLALACEENAPNGTTKDPRDNKTYKTIKIGEQVWMAENLNYEAEGSRCYNDSTAYCEKYGRLYDWKTAMQVCPDGWHLPTDIEWDELLHLADSTNWTKIPYYSKTAGKYLKAANGWKENGNGTDEHNFTALPGGTYSTYRFSDKGEFRDAGELGHWWTSSNGNGSQTAHARFMHYAYDYTHNYPKNQTDLYSVRCLKGFPYIPPAPPPLPPVVVSSFTDLRDNKTYKTTKIGSQIWLAENLNYAAKGSKCGGGGYIFYDIPPPEEREEGVIYEPDWIHLLTDENTEYCDRYGRLYDWKTATTACPEGWRMPSNSEWQQLITAIGGPSTAGTKLKTKDWDKGTDEYNFTALHSGYGQADGNFQASGVAKWWSLTEHNTTNAYYFKLVYSYTSITWDDDSKKNYASLRCLRD